MVIRSTISAVVFRMPYSDRLPPIVKTVLDDGRVKLDEGRFRQLEHTPDTVARPLSPKEKIHNRLMDKRLAESPVAMNRRTDLTASSLNPIFDEEDTLRETESVTSKRTVMQNYLDEQNAKFDDLINKNLGEVLKQQSQFEDDASWREIMFKLAMARNPTEVSSSLGLLVLRATKSVCLWMPFVESPTVSPDEESYGEAVLRSNNDLIQTNAISLDTMDYNEKVKLLRQLQRDLGLNNESDMTNFTQELSQKDRPLVDKIQMLMILLIRLAFMGFKLFVPISTAIYTKFKNNELMVLNNRNFNKLLNTVIHVMETMEERLDNETNNTRVPGIQTIEIFEEGGLAGGDSWASAVARYSMSRWAEDAIDNTDFTNDPRYAQYFAERRKMTIEEEETYLRGEHPSVFQVAQQFARDMG